MREALRTPTNSHHHGWWAGVSEHLLRAIVGIVLGAQTSASRLRTQIRFATKFAGCSERELQLLASELRQNHRLRYGREQVEITQKQLADFRRENATKQEILRQQRHDQETRAALVVLEGGRGKRSHAPTPTPTVESQGAPSSIEPEESEEPKNQQDKLLVFRRVSI